MRSFYLGGTMAKSTIYGLTYLAILFIASIFCLIKEGIYYDTQCNDKGRKAI